MARENAAFQANFTQQGLLPTSCPPLMHPNTHTHLIPSIKWDLTCFTTTLNKCEPLSREPKLKLNYFWKVITLKHPKAGFSRAGKDVKENSQTGTL
jgi:hypothetical protein